MKQIKEWIDQGEWDLAIEGIQKKLQTDLSGNQALQLAGIAAKVDPETLKKRGYLTKKIAVLGGYHTQFIAPLIRLYLLRLKIWAEVFEGDYGTFEQLIYSNDATLRSFSPDLCYFCVGSEHIDLSRIEDETIRWQRLWKTTQEFLNCDVIQNTFQGPQHRVFGNLEFSSKMSEGYLTQALNRALFESAPKFVHFSDMDAVAAHFGRKNWRDEKLYDLSKIPVSFDLLPFYAANVAGVASAVFGRSRKCLVLDLDNTLWGGVIGDDGLAKIQVGQGSPVGEAYLRFQKYILKLKKRGVILAVCSKNEEAIAKEPFLKHDGMALRLNDISCFIANWDPKSENIQRIAMELNIGIDSMVFVDDNPAEREIVRKTLPEVVVPELPEDPALYTSALSTRFDFETVSITNEDLQRTEQYFANRERADLEHRTTDYRSYLKELQMHAAVAAFDPPHLPRITQLINKTNQFNLTTRRYSDAEVEALTKDKQALTFHIKLLDKFGDNGLISVFIGRTQANVLEIDTWLMSCRVLKRGVEDLLMRQVVLSAQARGLKRIRGTYIPTAKNAMVKAFYPEFGFEFENELPGGAMTWTLDLENHAQVQKVLDREVFIDVS